MKIFTERLNQIYHQSGARSIKQFADAAGLVCGTLTDTLHNGTEPRYNILKCILKSNPDVSAEWLMRGEGEMYRSQRQQRTAGDVSITNSGDGNAAVNGDIIVEQEPNGGQLLKDLKEKLDEMDAQIRDLCELIKDKDGQTKKLLSLLEQKMSSKVTK